MDDLGVPPFMETPRKNGNIYLVRLAEAPWGSTIPTDDPIHYVHLACWKKSCSHIFGGPVQGTRLFSWIWPRVATLDYRSVYIYIYIWSIESSNKKFGCPLRDCLQDLDPTSASSTCSTSFWGSNMLLSNGKNSGHRNKTLKFGTDCGFYMKSKKWPMTSLTFQHAAPLDKLLVSTRKKSFGNIPSWNRNNIEHHQTTNWDTYGS